MWINKNTFLSVKYKTSILNLKLKGLIIRYNLTSKNRGKYHVNMDWRQVYLMTLETGSRWLSALVNQMWMNRLRDQNNKVSKSGTNNNKVPRSLWAIYILSLYCTLLLSWKSVESSVKKMNHSPKKRIRTFFWRILYLTFMVMEIRCITY